MTFNQFRAMEGAFDFESAITLFHDPYSADLVDRQVETLQKLLVVSREGYPLRDLERVAELLEVTRAKLTEHPDTLAPILSELLLISGKPFRLERANEELTEAQPVHVLLREVAECLHANHPRVELAAATALERFLQPPPPEFAARPGDARPSTWQLHQNRFRESGCIPRVVEAFRRERDELQAADLDGDGLIDMTEFYRYRVLNDADPDNDDSAFEAALRSAGVDTTRAAEFAEDLPDAIAEARAGDPWRAGAFLLEVLARVLLALSEHPDCAAAVTATGTPLLCLSVVGAVRDWRQPVIPVCLETIWNLCEHSAAALHPHHGMALSLQALLRKHRQTNACFLLATPSGFGTLSRLFLRLTREAYNMRDKALRNELVLLVTLFTRTPIPPAGAAEKISQFSLQVRAETEGGGGAARLLVDSGFFDAALYYATACETGLNSWEAFPPEERRRLELEAPPPRGEFGEEGEEEMGELDELEEDLYRLPDGELPARSSLFGTATEADLELKLLLWELVASAVRVERDARAGARRLEAAMAAKQMQLLGTESGASLSVPPNLAAPPLSSAESGESVASLPPARSLSRASLGSRGEEEGKEQSAASPPADGEGEEAAWKSPPSAAPMPRADWPEEMPLAPPANKAGGAGGEEDWATLEEHHHPADDAPEPLQNVRGGVVLHRVQQSLFIDALMAYLDVTQEAPRRTEGGVSPSPGRAAGRGGGGGFGSRISSAPPLPPPPSPRRKEAESEGEEEGGGEEEGMREVPRNPYFSLWTEEQKRRLELPALSILRLLVPVTMEQFVEAGGTIIPLTYLRRYAGLDRGAEEEWTQAVGGAGATAAGIMPPNEATATIRDPARVYSVLRLLQTACETKNGGVHIAAELGRAGAVDDALAIARSVGESSNPNETIRSASIASQQLVAAAADGVGGPEGGGPPSPALLREAALALLAALCQAGTGVPLVTRSVEGLVDADAAAASASEALKPPRAGTALPDNQAVAVELDAVEWMAAAFRGAVDERRATIDPSLSVAPAPRTGAAGSLQASLATATSSVAQQGPSGSRPEGEGEVLHATVQGRPAAFRPAASAALRRAVALAPRKGAAGKGAIGAEEEPAAEREEMAARLPLAFVTGLRAVLRHNPRAVRRWAVAGGPDAVLDWVESSQSGQRWAGLALLADALDADEEGTVRPLLREWRSDIDHAPAIAVLLRIWEEEEARKGIRHGPMGRVINRRRPLRGLEEDGEETEFVAEPDTPRLDLRPLDPSRPVRPKPVPALGRLEEGGGDATSTPESSPRPDSSAFDRLKEALRAARMWARVEGRDPSSGGRSGGSSASSALPSFSGLVGETDGRRWVWAVLAAVGWREVVQGALGALEELPLSQRLALELARVLPSAEVGGAWADVEDALAGGITSDPLLRVDPIASDAASLRAARLESQRTADKVADAQDKLIRAVLSATGAREDSFWDEVRARREAVEEGARLQVRARRRGPTVLNMEERKRAKEKKERMMQRAKKATGVRPFDPDLVE